MRVDEFGERIPLTVMNFDREKGTITIVVQDVGYSSTLITAMNVGDEFQDFVGPLGNEVVIATNDGSMGVKGFVTDGLAQVLAQGNQVKVIWAIGPLVMMKAVVDYTRPLGIKTIVSMNPIMVDGTGMCGACRISVGNETKFACVDGPEFDGHQVDFDLAMKRLAYYKDEENRAKARLECDHEGGHH